MTGHLNVVLLLTTELEEVESFIEAMPPTDKTCKIIVSFHTVTYKYYIWTPGLTRIMTKLKDCIPNTDKEEIQLVLYCGAMT